MNKLNWRQAGRDEPCPDCGKYDRYSIASDGTSRCHRCDQTHRAGKGERNGIAYIRRAHRPKVTRQGPAPKNVPVKAMPQAKAAVQVDWSAEHDRLRAAMTHERLSLLAESTGVPADAWLQLLPGWADRDDLRRLRAGGAGWADDPPEGAFVFAERDGRGRIIGLSLRTVDGRKGFCRGGGRGLTVPDNLHKVDGPVLAVEGAGDVAACVALGLRAVGRPNNRGGAADLAEMLDGMPLLVAGENDAKPGGAWPGRDGAKAVAEQVASRRGEAVCWSLPPDSAKDVRDWLKQRVADGLDVSDAACMKAAGQSLLAVMRQTKREATPPKRTQADALVDMALRHYRLGLSDDREAFAVAIDSPAVAMMFRGGGSALRATLAKLFRQQTGKTPNARALADALTALEGMALDAAPETVSLRLAAHDGGIVLDLGDSTGAAVVVSADGWRIVDASPVLFRRTALTGALPMPEKANPSGLLELRRLLNVGDDVWPLVVGWLVAALLPDIPHPVLMLGGEQGTGKSSAARMMIGLVDPSPAPLRTEPRDAEQWAVMASGSWIACIDNVSHIKGWFSDALCKAATGDGMVRRKLYADSDLAVLAFRRCIILTSIDPGAMRGDLGDRLLLLDLEPIPDDQRRTEAELWAAYRRIQSRLFGALLSAVSRVLAALPSVQLDRSPRMADFARVLAALDIACPELTGGRALDLFSGQRRRIADEVVEADPVGEAVVRLMTDRAEWTGTASDLLSAISPEIPPKGFPSNARALAGHMKRLRPALMQMGIIHVPPPASDKSRIHRIERGSNVEKGRNVPPIPPEPPGSGDSDAPEGIFDGRCAGGADDPTARPPNNRPTAQQPPGQPSDGKRRF